MKHFPLVLWVSVLSVCCTITHGVTLPKAQATPPHNFYGHFSNAALVDQNGKRFLASSALGHITLVNFVFSSCSSICPMQTLQLAQMVKNLKQPEAIRILSISIDPHNDTPDKLKQFAQRMKADVPEWSFVTGEQAILQPILDKLMAPPAPSSNPQTVTKNSEHSTSIWLLNQQGQVMQRYQGDPPDTVRIAQEIHQLSAL